MSCMFSLAADAFSLGHVVFEFLAGGDAASRLRDGVCEIPPVTLRSGACGGASFGDPIVRDLVSRLTRRVPEARIAVSAALRHPAFMSPQQLVDCVVSFSAAMGRAYAHGIPPWVVGGDTSLLAPSVSSSPELDYLEQAFVLHEEWGDGGGSVDWILRLDRQRLVCWPEPAPAASPSDSKEQSFSSPRQFFELYRSSRRPCLGESPMTLTLMPCLLEYCHRYSSLARSQASSKRCTFWLACERQSSCRGDSFPTVLTCVSTFYDRFRGWL